jgi:hypothetical protein
MNHKTNRYRHAYYDSDETGPPLGHRTCYQRNAFNMLSNEAWGRALLFREPVFHILDSQKTRAANLVLFCWIAQMGLYAYLGPFNTRCYSESWEACEYRELHRASRNSKSEPYINILPLRPMTASQVRYDPRYASHKTNPAWDFTT